MLKKILIGLFAGLICGFFGAGGGMILVPGFIYVLKKEPKEARATSICCVLPMVIVSSIFYYKKSYIDWKTAILCSVGGTIGGIFGAKLLNVFPEKLFKIIFTIFLIYASIKFII